MISHHLKKTDCFLCPFENCEKTCTTHYNLIKHVNDAHQAKLSKEQALAQKMLVNNPKKAQIAKATKRIQKEIRKKCICLLCGIQMLKKNLNKHMKKKHKGNFRSHLFFLTQIQYTSTFFQTQSQSLQNNLSPVQPPLLNWIRALTQKLWKRQKKVTNNHQRKHCH